MELKKLIKNKVKRAYACKQSLQLFFSVYFTEYITKELATFQKEMMQLVETKKKYSVFLAFRNSGKSTILSTCFPIWSIIGKPQKKFVLIITQTTEQARQMLKNIKRQLESNSLLVQDFGHFKQSDDVWKNNTLVLPKYGAQIMALSRDQSVRGLIHGAHRPDLIVVDDIEDLDSAKTYDGRKNVYDTFKGEIVPMGSDDCQLIVIGNLVHSDCLVMKLIAEIEKGHLPGVYNKYPIANELDEPLWPGMYPTKEALRMKELEINDYVTYQREYMLNIVDEPDQIILAEWIGRYHELPEKGLQLIATSIDPASSENTNSCYTAMVSFKVYRQENGQAVIYVLPNPINRHLRYPDIITLAKEISLGLGDGMPTKLFVEQAGQQEALVQLLQEHNLPAEGIKIAGIDKQTRLKNISLYIKDHRILFPYKDAEALISQLVFFGKEKNNDLCDALTLIAPQILNEYSGSNVIVSTGGKSIFDDDNNEGFKNFENGNP